MKMNGPGEYKIPNTYPMIHEPAIPRALSDTEYRAVLISMLADVKALGGIDDPAYTYTVFELEEAVIAAGLNLPIVRRLDVPPSE